MIGITSTGKDKGLNKSPKTALSPTFQPPYLPIPCRANTKPPSPIGTSRSSHLSPETNIKSQNQLIYRNLKEYRCKPQNSPVWLVQGAAIFIYIAAPCTTEIHTENQHLTLLVKPRVQPRFLHRLLILCFSCNPVIPKNKKSPKHFPFSVKIPIFASVPRAERSNAAKPAQLPNRYRLPNFLLFKSYLPTDYKKTIVFLGKTVFSISILLTLIFSKYIYMASLNSYYTFYLIHKFGVSVQTSQICLFVFLIATAMGTLAGGPIGDKIGRKYVIWGSILGAAPFSLLMPHVGFVWTIVLSFCVGLVLSSAFPAILLYAQELLPYKLGLISGLFFGFAFGVAGIASAVLGNMADHYGIEAVYNVCGFMPLLGLVTWFLPNLKKK